MPFIPFPNVPNVPGVPSIPRNPFAAISAVAGIVSNIAARANIAAAVPPAWGVYGKGGTLAIRPDSIQAFAFNNQYNISKFPIEAGSFNDYNKVANPFEIRLILVKGGSERERAFFLSDVRVILDSDFLYDIVTPEETFIDVNMTSMTYSKATRNGANLMIVEALFEEVRQAPAAQYSEVDATTAPISQEQTDSVNAASIRSNGQTQPASPTGYAAGVYNLTGVQ